MQCIIMSKMQPFPNNTDIIINNQQPHQNQSPSSSSSSSTSNLSPSILTISLILIITLLATVSLILLIRRFRLPNRHHHPSSSTSSSISSHRHVSNDSVLIDSLPLFSFSSASCRDGDCAVCLSKFQPHDQLRLLPLCCHAFHAPCVDSWLRSNLTCPLCRSTVIVFTSDDLADRSGDSFRLEIGSVSQRRPDSVSSGHRRSYSMGSFDYVVEAESEVAASNGYGRSSFSGGKAAVPPSTPPDEARLAADVAGGMSWVSECMDRVAATVSSRSLSFRSSGRFFTGSSRRSNVGDVAELNLEAGSIEDEISELFRWASGV